MNAPVTDVVAAAIEQGTRKIWSKPEPVILPIEETATGSSTGNDGNTPTTHS